MAYSYARASLVVSYLVDIGSVWTEFELGWFSSSFINISQNTTVSLGGWSYI
jgi:hypothetical protein